jgi:hypothetical protein
MLNEQGGSHAIQMGRLPLRALRRWLLTRSAGAMRKVFVALAVMATLAGAVGIYAVSAAPTLSCASSECDSSSPPP